MEEAPENDRELLHSAHANGMNGQQDIKVKTVVFCDVTPHSLLDITNVSNEGADSIFTSILKKGAVSFSEMLTAV